MSAQAGTGRSRPHILALDIIRTLIVALVIGVHTLTIAAGDITEPLGAFVTVLHTSRALFFLLTAFVLTYNYGDRRQLRRMAFWCQRLRFVIPAYVIWTLIYFLADGERLDPVSSALAAFGRDLLSGDARYQLYFLLVTMQVYLAFPLLRWLLQRTARHHLALLLAAGAYELALTCAIQHDAVTTGLIGQWFRNPDPLLPSYLFYVIAGAIAGWHLDRFAAFTRRHLTAARMTFLAGLLAGVGTYFAEVCFGGRDPAAASAVFQPVVVVESVTLAWALFAAGLIWADAGARHRRLVSAGADSSFGIYLVHPLVLQGAVALAGATGILAAIRGAQAAAQLAAFLVVGVPLIYGVSWALTFLTRGTPLSMVLTGRQRKAGAGKAATKPVTRQADLALPAALRRDLCQVRGLDRLVRLVNPVAVLSRARGSPSPSITAGGTPGRRATRRRPRRRTSSGASSPAPPSGELRPQPDRPSSRWRRR
jgi:peptidoglycan/LPS O-acetylase OafA/YrhL